MSFAGAKSDLYIGGSIGQASQHASIGGFNFDDDDTGYKVFGGYSFSLVPFLDFAVEASYIDFGEANDTMRIHHEYHK